MTKKATFRMALQRLPQVPVLQAQAPPLVKAHWHWMGNTYQLALVPLWDPKHLSIERLALWLRVHDLALQTLLLQAQ
jgi:hypothetical protein